VGVWVWGLGSGPPTPNPQSPIPNPQSPLFLYNSFIESKNLKNLYKKQIKTWNQKDSELVKMVKNMPWQ